MHTCSKCKAEFEDVKCKACGDKPMACADGECKCAACGKAQPENDVFCDDCLAAGQEDDK